MSQFSDLKDAVDALEEDFSKFYDKGNASAMRSRACAPSTHCRRRSYPNPRRFAR